MVVFSQLSRGCRFNSEETEEIDAAKAHEAIKVAVKYTAFMFHTMAVRNTETEI